MVIVGSQPDPDYGTVSFREEGVFDHNIVDTTSIEVVGLSYDTNRTYDVGGSLS